MRYVEAKGVRIPQIGFGTWELRGGECARMVQEALRIGYRHLDTAQVYENEAEVGEGLKAVGLPRDEVFVTTKLALRLTEPKDFERAAKDSLTRLKLSEVDLLLLHWPPLPPLDFDETMENFVRLRSLGLTRNLGVSNFTVSQLEQLARISREPVICNQIEVHPFLDQTKVLAACRRHGIAGVAYSPIARGRTMGNDVLERIGRKHGKSSAQVSLRWLIQQDLVVIPRTSSPDRAQEDFEVFDFELEQDEMLAITRLARPDGRIVNPAWAPAWD
jgi:diketogulonate reductase-like aldo/keto reductase